MTEQDIAQYLRGNPAFFERQADLLAEICLISPHSRRTVSLQERQAELLREKIRMLEGRLMDMIRHGGENLALSDKLLRWARDLFLVEDVERLPVSIAESIQLQFAVPQAALRLWGVDEAFAGEPWAHGVSEDARLLADSLREPFCGVNSGFEATQWLPHPSQAVSMALLPLRPLQSGQAGPTFGMLVLASPDAQRYTSTMGTEFLTRIAEVASAALSRLR
ncbi:MAG: DUF484 family protein [Curvibacter sp.]|jgi:uncharacterized protein YigA (DUF484 family)|nr:DUF484 family protein [Curvibacter sp.]